MIHGGWTMNTKKWVPWNWFKKEQEQADKALTVQRQDPESDSPIERFHRETDRFFDKAFRGFVLGRSAMPPMADGILKPTLDLSAADNKYTISIEVPGVDEKDVDIEIANDTLTIRCQKRQDSEERSKDFYHMERSYGSFQRTLVLPEDADQDGAEATYKNGVLTVHMPRKALPKTDVKRIEVKSV
jgi:HSP20 family protein